MRPPPSVFVSGAAYAAARLPLPEPPLALQDDCGPRPCRFPPPQSHSSGNFEANAMVFLIILLCALICSLALHAAVRCFLRRGGGEDSSLPLSDPGPSVTAEPEEEESGGVVPAPAVAYTAGMGLAGEECAICLTEFEEGEAVRVLERCRHGFHVACIERWLRSRSSCPNCRASCLMDSPSSSSSNLSKRAEERERRPDDCNEDGGGRQRRAEEPESRSEQL